LNLIKDQLIKNFYYLNQNFFYLYLEKDLIELDGTFTGTNDEP